MWLGPPYMKRKMTDLARGAKWGERKARGFVRRGPAADASRSSSPRSATRPNPAPRPGSGSRRSKRTDTVPIHVGKLIAIKKHMAETDEGQARGRRARAPRLAIRSGPALQKIDRFGDFVAFGLMSQRH